MKRLIFLLLIIMVLSCACNSNTQLRDVVIEDPKQFESDENSVESLITEKDVSSQNLQESALTIRQDDYESMKESAYKWLEQDGYLFLIDSFYNKKFSCRLLALNENFDRSIQCDLSDYLFAFYMEADYLDVNGTNDKFEITLDSEMKLIKITVEETNYLINFENETYTTEIEYRKKDLDPDLLIDKNSDDTLELYVTNLANAGEWEQGDYVVYNTKTQDIVYLAPYRSLSVDAIFCNDLVLICWFDEIKLFDARTGELCLTAPQFEYGQPEREDTPPKYYTVGIAFDDKTSKTLVAFREYIVPENLDNTCAVYVAVFDDKGMLTKTMNTGLMMQIIAGSWLNRISFELTESDTAIISTNQFKEYEPIEKIVLGEISY